MIFNTKNTKFSGENYKFDGDTNAFSHKVLNKDVIKELWFGHTFRKSEIKISEIEEFKFVVGNPDKISLDGNSYAINVDKNGIYMVAENELGLIHAFMTLIDHIRMDDEGTLEIKCFETKESPLVKTRMVHYCITPETQLWEHERFIRLCGALKYSHIILEFWGVLKFDCMKELSWEFGYTKDEIKPLIELAKDLGLEVVPMFNHWGHAAGCREAHGKHVVLDQNPSLQSYFSDDGWCWNIKSQRTRDLLKKIRQELLEMCGDGEYFHIGCDEARGFDFSEESMSFICDFLNRIGEDLAANGRKTIVWGDMFVAQRDEFKAESKYIANAKNIDAEKFMLERLDENLIIADWQYWVKDNPVKTSVIFKNAGFKVFVCPWDRGEKETKACVATASNCADGLIHTTWNTLSKWGMICVMKTAADCWNDVENDHIHWHTTAAAVLRKVYFTDGDFAKAGWSAESWKI